MNTKELRWDLPAWPARPIESHKGDFGRILIVAGSRGMSGAAILAGSAALRGGAGLVRVAVPETILESVASGHPCYMTLPLPADTQGRLDRSAWLTLESVLAQQDVLAIGPGLGGGENVQALVHRLIQEFSGPVVLDADGLNALVGQTECLRNPAGPRILTPHPGELARLLQIDTRTLQAKRADYARDFAREFGVVLVLKGHASIITDGTRVALNTTGNPGMASGGTGDVLTGLVAALLGQGFEPFAAGQLGAYLHGDAGDLARDALGEVSLLATDLLDFLPQAIRKYRETNPSA